MKANLILAAACIAILAGAVSLYYTFRTPPAPGKGRRAEIIHPVTKARIKTTWQQVFQGNPPARRDLFSNGGWLAPVPGTDLWGYVVDEHASHPSETQPADPPATP